mmetsp:Transcript_40952/g.49169  ORF Transcript_40952/g.49169 Transcript_40952/m.49169 type:complete len:241 (-) Transcript_40952:185-907(-)
MGTLDPPAHHTHLHVHAGPITPTELRVPINQRPSRIPLARVRLRCERTQHARQYNPRGIFGFAIVAGYVRDIGLEHDGAPLRGGEVGSTVSHHREFPIRIIVIEQLQLFAIHALLFVHHDPAVQKDGRVGGALRQFEDHEIALVRAFRKPGMGYHGGDGDHLSSSRGVWTADADHFGHGDAVGRREHEIGGNQRPAAGVPFVLSIVIQYRDEVAIAIDWGWYAIHDSGAQGDIDGHRVIS